MGNVISVNSDLAPAVGCRVRTVDDHLGLVRDARRAAARVDALVAFRSHEPRWLPAGELSHAYRRGDQVRHAPPKGRGRSLGVGEVLQTRRLAGFDQVLVQFAESGETRWLDWRVLAQATPVEQRIAQRQVGQHDDHAERVRLRLLGKALRIWDANTGAFGRLDIDPLPHQLDVARRVVTSDQARWLIADDVGLGKTIEVGLILHALAQRNRCRRVLVVCPSSLTEQWKTAMRVKFGRAFEIYGRDFTPEYADEMRRRENVIVSLDLAKREEHAARFLGAGTWDVVVFDEAHRLAREASGEQTERYRLARALSNSDRTGSFLLLTATPHQGKTDKFAALLELVRPDLLSEIRTLEMNPEIVGDIIIRNRKTKVTDAQGRLLFRGHDTRRLMVTPSPEMRAADAALQSYLRRGYRAGAQAADRTQGRAIGFVMTTYRKLASSSVAAIEHALERRLARLSGGTTSWQGPPPSADEVEDDDHLEDNAVASGSAAFFEDEDDELRHVLGAMRRAKEADAKLAVFVRDVAAPLMARGESLLVFTEYRATQAYLVEALARHVPGAGPAALINGSMAPRDRSASIEKFNSGSARVLVSTEAGGEGLNLQESCHVMVNYDLPWNPARLVQRIGRLYRYGQTKRVQVVNLQSDDGFDSAAISLMLDRVMTMARDMAAVAKEAKSALESDILGELLSRIDMEDILERATTLRIEQTEEEIAAAIAAAREAREVEGDILQFAAAHEGEVRGGFDARHMLSFVEGMLAVVGIHVRGRLHEDRTIEIELPEAWVGRYPEFGRRSVVRLTVDHARANADPSLVLLDFDVGLVRDLAEYAANRIAFDGLYGEVAEAGAEGLMAVHQVRWQNHAGTLLEEELVASWADKDGVRALEHDAFAAALLAPSKSVAPALSCSSWTARPQELSAAVETEIARRSRASRMPGSVFLAGALRRGAG